jgi:hypothetical protein
MTNRHTAEPLDRAEKGTSSSYLRFGAMIATAMAAMYALTYVNSWDWAHLRWSETRLYMTLLMGATMAVIMLGFMLGMYRRRWVNIGIIVGSVVLFAASTWLVRSQETVDDASYMSAMIPHHSIAILTSERAQIEDHRVCELALGIIEAQRREIDEMDWLIADIAANGPAKTPTEAASRPVPEFEGTSTRDCASG